MKTYRVIAKDDLVIEGEPHHRWKKGHDYEVVEKEDYFILATERGQVNYYLSVKNQALANFVKEGNHE